MLWFKPRKKKQIERLEVKIPGNFDYDGLIDAYSPTWVFVRKWLEVELINARERNDFQKLTELKTAALRGRIKLLKEILKLPENKT